MSPIQETPDVGVLCDGATCDCEIHSIIAAGTVTHSPAIATALDIIQQATDSPTCASQPDVAAAAALVSSSIDSIDALLDAADKLRTWRSTLSQALGKVQLTRQNIHCLPLEILSLIFSMVSEPNTFSPHWHDPYVPLSRLIPSPSARTANLLVPCALACRRWRDVAFHTRALWKRIPVSINRSGDVLNIDAFDGALNYADGIPLEFVVSTSDFKPQPSSHRILDRMTSMASQISHLDLSFSLAVIPVLHGVLLQLVNLYSLRVFSVGPISQGRHIKLNCASHPTLRIVHLVNFFVTNHAEFPQELRELSIKHHGAILPEDEGDRGPAFYRYWTPESLAQVLTPMASLERLALDMAYDKLSLVAEKPLPLHLPALCQLTLSANEDEALIDFLSRLHAPNLSDLRLGALSQSTSSSLSGDGGAAMFDTITGLARRARCVFTSLHLHRTPRHVRRATVISFLQSLDTLQVLCLRRTQGVGLPYWIAAALAYGEEEKDVRFPPLPALRVIDLRSETFDEDGLQALATVLKEYPSNVERVNLAWGSRFFVNMVERAQRKTVLDGFKESVRKVTGLAVLSDCSVADI